MVKPGETSTENDTAVTPATVHDTLRKHMLVDGLDLVLDTKASRGSSIVDARDGSRRLDMFSFFASAPLGMNHPGLVDDPEFMAELATVAANKPSNSDVYTTHMIPRSRTCSSSRAARWPSRTR
jgi:L-lysine 6-transaminase